MISTQINCLAKIELTNVDATEGLILVVVHTGKKSSLFLGVIVVLSSRQKLQVSFCGFGGR